MYIAPNINNTRQKTGYICLSEERQAEAEKNLCRTKLITEYIFYDTGCSHADDFSLHKRGTQFYGRINRANNVPLSRHRTRSVPVGMSSLCARFGLGRGCRCGNGTRYEASRHVPDVTGSCSDEAVTLQQQSVGTLGMMFGWSWRTTPPYEV